MIEESAARLTEVEESRSWHALNVKIIWSLISLVQIAFKLPLKVLYRSRNIVDPSHLAVPIRLRVFVQYGGNDRL